MGSSGGREGSGSHHHLAGKGVSPLRQEQQIVPQEAESWRAGSASGGGGRGGGGRSVLAGILQ